MSEEFRHFDKPVFFLQNNYYDRLGRMIAPCLEFCRNNGFDVVDRSLTEEFDPMASGMDLGAWPGVVVYGSVGWIKACRTGGLAPWVYYDPMLFASERWAAALGDNALNGEGQVISAAELEERLARGEVLHARPDHDDKAFTGAVYDREAWHAMARRRREDRHMPIPADLECFVSPVKRIDAEHRCWFVDGDLVEVSQYRRNGELNIARVWDPGLRDEIEALAGLHLPVRHVVMDVAGTADGLKVLEYNPINSSGWYAGDVTRILSELSVAVMREHGRGNCFQMKSAG